jgi:hypothetical protein
MVKLKDWKNLSTLFVPISHRPNIGMVQSLLPFSSNPKWPGKKMPLHIWLAFGIASRKCAKRCPYIWSGSVIALGMIVPELSKMQMLKGKASPAISMVIYL